MTVRTDLAALSDDDLVALTNRGTLKRAARELAEGMTCELELLDDGALHVRWSDGPECRFPAGGTVREAVCTCAATGVCRHVVRSVLAYPAGHAADDGEPPPPAPWCPGTIGDDVLAHHYTPAALAAARRRFAEGVVIEAVRGAKPLARLESESLCVRFQVEGDPRYTHCDCAEPAPCSHVPLAVWAFRRLAEGEVARLVASAPRRYPVPGELLDEVDGSLAELVAAGVSTLTGAWRDRVARQAARLADEDLPWPSAVLGEMVDLYDRYHARDARFSAERLAALAGEWTARRRAIASDAVDVPQLLVRGTRSDRTVELGSSRLVGLGCHARIAGGEAVITAFFQDSDSGTMAAFVRAFPDPAPDAGEPRALSELARRRVVKGATLATLGGGQILINGARRSPDRALVFGRKAMTVSPQNFAWDRLKQPALAEGFAEVKAHLSTLPPAVLRPRRITDSLFVCPVASVEEPGFDRLTQSVEATLVDGSGERARMVHPYHGRARQGAEALLARLRDADQRACWIAGCVQLDGQRLVIEPTAVVFEHGDGSRTAVQPWVDAERVEPGRATAPGRIENAQPESYLHELSGVLGDACVVGLRGVDRARLREVARLGAAMGYVRLAGRARVVVDELERASHDVRWTPARAARAALGLAMRLELARELG